MFLVVDVVFGVLLLFGVGVLFWYVDVLLFDFGVVWRVLYVILVVRVVC